MSSNTPENPYDKPAQPGPPSYNAPAPTAAPAPYGQQPPAFGQAPSPYGQQPQFAAPAVDPGKTMGIIALVLPFVGFSLVGLILGIVAKIKSKKAGFKNTPALIAIIVAIVITIGSIIAIIVGITMFMNFTNEITEACVNGAETVTISGQEFPCEAVVSP